MMPEDVPWPTTPWREYPDYGFVYLHFVAQIACEDLPADLWGGLGPRTGWLLLFLDAQEPCIDPMKTALQVVHIQELGPERPAPEGTQPMRNELYTGYSFDFYRSPEEVPSTWRRWPVDIVAFPNEMDPELLGEVQPDAVAVRPPRMTAEALYEGAEIESRWPITKYERNSRDEAAWPFTWRGALYVVDSIIRNVTSRRPVELESPYIDWFEDSDWPAREIPRLQAEKDHLVRRLAASEARLAEEQDTETRAKAQKSLDHHRARLAERSEVLRLFEEHRDAAGLLSLRSRVKTSMKTHNDWLRNRLPDLQVLREAILKHDLDSSLSVEEFRPIFNQLSETKSGYLNVTSEGGGRVVQTFETSLLDYAGRGFGAARGEVATDLYVKSAKARSLIPQALLESCEPKWRMVKRPHRMGGWHDGIQSSTGDISSDNLLLFQIASDDPMQWCWGDDGAYFVFISASDLSAGRFDRIDWRFETY